MKLVDIFVSAGLSTRGSINMSSFRVFEKFVKKVMLHNPMYLSHLRIRDQTMSTLEASSLPQQIRVPKLKRCAELKTANFRGLRKLCSLFISNCTKLVEITGWKFLRELGWLEIKQCPSFQNYPGLRDHSSLREFRFNRAGISDRPQRVGLNMSQCVRLRRLEIWCDEVLEESGDLSSLKCLETLSFEGCTALSTISGLSGLHLLTYLILEGCKGLQRLPDIGHMQELVRMDICGTGLEEIPGVEKLVSLKKLDCCESKLKWLPELHQLPGLRKVLVKGTRLIEDDPSSLYFDNEEVVFHSEESRHVEVSDISDTEYNLSDNDGASGDDSLSCDDAD